MPTNAKADDIIPRGPLLGTSVHGRPAEDCATSEPFFKYRPLPALDNPNCAGPQPWPTTHAYF